MWSNTQAGGFMSGGLASPGSMTTPGGGSSGGGQKKRAQNIVPVQVREILESPEEGFQIEGIEVGMVIILGKVTSATSSTTKTTLMVEDDTGSVEVVQWVDEDAKEKGEYTEGSFVRVVGNVRSQGDKKHVMAFKIMGVPSQAEMDAHLLEIVHSHLKMKQVQTLLEGGATGGGGGLSNSMMGGGLSQAGGVQGSVSNQSFGNAKHDLVYGCIRQSMDDVGIHKDQLMEQVRTKMSKSELDNSLEFLSAEGHIYSTVDEDHFKSTDGE